MPKRPAVALGVRCLHPVVGDELPRLCHPRTQLAAYNFAHRLKSLSGLAPYENTCKIWSSEPDRFIVNPINDMPGLNRPLSLRAQTYGPPRLQAAIV
jgi:hypothetical protein